MCYVCCKELRGWCKSFTLIEGLLFFLEAILFVLFIGFLVFLILHFTACAKLEDTASDYKPFPPYTTTLDTKNESDTSTLSPSTTPSDRSTSIATVGPHVSCTWQPERPTSPATRYYVTHRQITTTPSSNTHVSTSTSKKRDPLSTSLEPLFDYDDVELLEALDGESADEIYNKQVVALVKLQTPGDLTFGCILSKISRYWTLTAASCIEAVEEVESLESFVIVEGWGGARARGAGGVAGVWEHPAWGGRSLPHDLAAVRAARPLSAAVLRLPTPLDSHLLAIGERLHILGYGGYRTVLERVSERRLRQVDVYVVSSEQCGGAAGEGWAARHLAGGAVLRQAGCGAGGLCAGSRLRRARPCNYCGGAPLTRGGLLLGVMSHNPACAVSCEPHLYVNIATLRDWIHSVIIEL